MIFLARYPLLLFLAINAVLLAAYCWSSGGQSTDIRVVARGDAFEAFVDGKLQSRQRIDQAPMKGGIALSMEDSRKIPSLPRPRGIDRVRVADAESGAVLFYDDFSSGLADEWTLTSGRAVAEGGVLDLQQQGSIFLGARDWGDVIVDVTMKNVTGVTVVVRAQAPTTGVAYSVRPFRQYDSNLAHLTEGMVISGFTGGQPFPTTEQSIRSTLAMVLRPYPIMFVLMLAGLGVVTGVQFADVLWRKRTLPRLPDQALTLVAGALGLAAFAVAVYLISNYTDRMPHVQDDVSYVFQAKIFASGHLAAPAPPVDLAFDIARPPFVVAVEGKWASVYPFGHPLALAAGQLFGVGYIIPPLLGAITVFLTFIVGRKLYEPTTALLAALLLASSPFFFMTSASFMSHTTSTFFLLACFYCLLSTGHRTAAYGVGAGLFFGLLFNTQSLSAVALTVPLGGYLLARLLPRDARTEAAHRIGGFVVGGAVMFGAYVLYNITVRGDPLLTGNAAAGFASSVGFGDMHSVNLGINNEQIQMTFLILVLNGWPVWIGLMFILALFTLATRNAWDYLLLAYALFLIGAYTFFIGHGLMYGPRYWYPAAPFLMLLTARGAHHTADLLAVIAGTVRRRLTGASQIPRWAARAAVYAVIAALIGSSISSWLLSRHVGWVADFVPARAVELQGFNGADDRLINVIEDADLRNALVLVNECSAWQCYGTVFWLNSPTLDSDVVIARNIPERLPELFEAYPGRDVYVASHNPPAIVPFGFSTEQAFGVPLSQFPPPPQGASIRLPSPTPTSTPETGGDSVGRDEQRRADMATIEAALLEYKTVNGTYPSTGNSLQSLCRYPADAGCSLTEQLTALPIDPSPRGTYYYASDGSTFLLVAIMENPVMDHQCPQDLPGDVRKVPNPFCVLG